MQHALEILGLSAGADYRDVELAYRSLIKQYHPDRAGGDAARAAEINRAYSELRQVAWLAAPAAAGASPAQPLNRGRRLGQGVFAASVLAAGAMLAWGHDQPAASPVVASAGSNRDEGAAAKDRPSSKGARIERAEIRDAPAPGVRKVGAPRAGPGGARPVAAFASRGTAIASGKAVKAGSRGAGRPVATQATAASVRAEPRAAPPAPATPPAPKVIPAWQRPLRQPWQQPLSTGERG